MNQIDSFGPQRRHSLHRIASHPALSWFSNMLLGLLKCSSSMRRSQSLAQRLGLVLGCSSIITTSSGCDAYIIQGLTGQVRTGPELSPAKLALIMLSLCDLSEHSSSELRVVS